MLRQVWKTWFILTVLPVLVFGYGQSSMSWWRVEKRAGPFPWAPLFSKVQIIVKIGIRNCCLLPSEKPQTPRGLMITR
jgi:hypothetical protein